MARRSDGEGSIGKRKDGTFYGAVRLDGKRRWVYGETRKEVVDQLRALAQKHEQGASIEGGKLKLGEFLDRWLSEVAQHRNKPRTFLGYEKIVEHHLKPELGHIQLGQLRPDRVQQFVGELTRQKKSPRTIRNIRAVLRQALNQAVRWRYITTNAASLVEIPRVERYTAQPFTKEEARAFLESIKGHRLEVLYLLALLLGLRQGELLGLLIDSIDFTAGTIRIDGTLQYVRGELIRQTTKTTSSYRVLPLPPSLVPLLKEHMRRERERFPKSEYIFNADKGGPLSPFTVTPQFQALLKKAGLRHIRFHDLRHSCATFLIARGEHPRVVMDILGHSTIGTTMSIYGHVLDTTRTTAVTGLDAYLSDG